MILCPFRAIRCFSGRYNCKIVSHSLVCLLSATIPCRAPAKQSYVETLSTIAFRTVFETLALAPTNIVPAGHKEENPSLH